MNLELNFVYNSDIKLGHYKLALKGLKNVVRVRSDHAFAHYYMSMCYFYIKDFINAKKHLSSYVDLVNDVFWRKYINLYNLPILTKKTLNNITDSSFAAHNYDELIAV